MDFLAASRLAMANHVCYWLAMATVQHGWLERPKRLSTEYTVVY